MRRARNPVARAFFEGQFAAWPQEFIETSISPVLNKVEAFTVNQKIRNVLGQERSKLHFEHALRHGRIVIAKLAKGAVGDKPAFLMGSLLLGPRAGRRHGARARRQRSPAVPHRHRRGAELRCRRHRDAADGRAQVCR